MIRQTLILAAAILVATAAHAQVDVAAVKEFVSTIESLPIAVTTAGWW